MASHEGPDPMHTAAIDDAAQALLFAWDQAREQVTPRVSWPQLNALLAVERSEDFSYRNGVGENFELHEVWTRETRELNDGH